MLTTKTRGLHILGLASQIQLETGESIEDVVETLIWLTVTNTRLSEVVGDRFQCAVEFGR